MISLAWHPTCIMSHRLRAEGLPVKCLPPPPQDPVPEGEDVGTLLDWDGEQQCWLHDGMLHRKRVQVSKRCSELLAPLLCSSPIPYWVVVLCLSFLALILCLFPSSLPQFQRRVRIPLARKSCRLLPSWGLGTSAPDFAAGSQKPPAPCSSQGRPCLGSQLVPPCSACAIRQPISKKLIL